MRTILKVNLILVLALFASCSVLFAQDRPTEERPEPDPEPEPRLTDAKPISRHPIKIGERPERPRPSAVSSVDVPERVQPAELKTLIERFRSAREDYLKDQKEVLRQLEEATDEQRTALREKLRDDLDAWRETQLELRTQVRERAREIKAELNRDLKRVVESGSAAEDVKRPRE